MDGKKILIIRIDRLGDLILSTPFIRTVKENFPSGHVAVMVRPYTKGVLENNPFVDEVIVYEEHREKNIMRDIKNSGFDWMIVLSPLFKAYYLAARTGSSQKFTFVYSTRIISRFFVNLFFNKFLVLKIDEALRKKGRAPHEVEQMMMFAEFLGLKVKSDELDFHLTKNEEEYGRKLLDYRRGLREKYFIGLHLSSKWLAKDFTINDLIAFIYEVQKEFPDAGLVLTYGPQDIGMAIHIKKDKILRSLLIGGVSIREWASLIKEFKFFITMDTGATHIASIFKIPTLCIYEDRHFDLCSSQWHPWKTPHFNLKRGQIKSLTGEHWKKMRTALK